MNSNPCDPRRLQKSKPALRRAENTSVGATFADGSISLMASTTSAVEKKWVASAGVGAGGVSLLQCSYIDTDVGYWLFGVIFFIAHILKNLN